MSDEKSKVIREWTTYAGYPAVVLKISLGHLVGYVAIPKDHQFHGAHYSTPSGKDWEYIFKRSVGKRGVIELLSMAYRNKTDTPPTICDVIDVHGSITFMKTGNDYPIETTEQTTWVGFDCAHSGDTPEKCDEEYVSRECELLAYQLRDFA